MEYTPVNKLKTRPIKIKSHSIENDDFLFRYRSTNAATEAATQTDILPKKMDKQTSVHEMKHITVYKRINFCQFMLNVY